MHRLSAWRYHQISAGTWCRPVSLRAMRLFVQLPSRQRMRAGLHRFAFVLAFTCLLGSADPAQCAWLEAGARVCNGPTHQTSLLATLLSNGDAAIVVSGENQSAQNYIMVQRVNAVGDNLWGADGIQVHYNSWVPTILAVVADNAGGFTVIWRETQSEFNYFFSRHVDANGNVGASNTLAYATGRALQWGGAISCSDNTFLIAWVEDGSLTDRVWVDRFSHAGISVWAGALMAMDDATGIDKCVAVASIADGVMLGVLGSSGKISAVRVAANKIKLWQCVVRPEPANDLIFLDAAPDGTGGAFFTWRSSMNGTMTAWGQRVAANGSVAWGAIGLPLQESLGNIDAPQVCSIDSGRAMFLTSDLYTSPNTSRRTVIDTSGTTVSSMEVSASWNYRSRNDATSFQGRVLTYCEDGNFVRGIMIESDCSDTWNDPRGVIVLARAQTGYGWRAFGLPDGSVFMTWIDTSGGLAKAFYSRRNANGYFADPAPGIAVVADVAQDEGGYVAVTANASRFDASDKLYSVAAYAVWRSRGLQVDDGAFRAACRRFADMYSGSSGLMDVHDGRQWGMNESAPVSSEWELVGYAPAMRLNQYRIIVPTYADSTASGTQMVDFRVSAHAQDPAVYFYSQVSSGYSVDNLAPASPTNLQFAPIASGYLLSWSASQTLDLAFYRVYGGLSPGSTLAPGTFLGESRCAEFELSGAGASGVTFCRVTAVDRHGNESVASEAIQLSSMRIRVTDVPDDQGGMLRTSWQRHALDSALSPGLITGYQVQRYAGDWQVIGAIAAAFADSYSVNVPSPDIFTIGQPVPLSRYRVVAIGSVPGVMYDSPADSACSVDNLPPAPPQLILNDTETSRILAWINDTVPDVRETCLYRGLAPGFEATSPVICSGTLPYYIEADLNRYYYRARTIDIHGNVGEWSQELVGRWPTGVPGALPLALRLYPCQPNPFNPRTTIKYDLPEAGPVRLSVFDLAGRLVRTLVEENRPQGSFEAVWDGRDVLGREVSSGTYLARLSFGGRVETVRMGLVR